MAEEVGGQGGPMGFGFDPSGQAISTSYQDYILPRNSDAFHRGSLPRPWFGS